MSGHDRRNAQPATVSSRPRPGIRTSPKPPLSTGVFCEFRCHEPAVRDLTTPATTGRWRFAQNFSGRPLLDDRFAAANLDPALAQPGHNRPVGISQPPSSERQFHSETCLTSYFGTSARAVVLNANLVRNGTANCRDTAKLRRRRLSDFRYFRIRP